MKSATLIATVLSLMPWATTLPVAMSTGCMGCTNADADGGLIIRVDAAPGNYRVETTAEGETLVLAFRLTTDGIPGCDGIMPCRKEGVGLFLEVRSTDGKIDARVAHHQNYTGPDSVVLRVFRDDVPVHETTIVADYRTYYPNGDDCEPEAHVANADVVVP
jgi:hypothetical protein